MDDWRDLDRLIQKGDWFARGKTANALGKVFSQIPNKTQAWQDLHSLTQDGDSYVRGEATSALGKAFSQIPDNAQAWQDLIRLIRDRDRYVRWHGAEALAEVFSQTSDKIKAWQNLQRLIQDENSYVRGGAVYALGKAFSQIPDNAHAWQDLLRLTQDENNYVRSRAAYALGGAFSQLPDKAQAWQDLHRLTQDENNYVRSRAAYALGGAFSQLPDNAQAWQDLHRLTQDKDSKIRWRAAEALGKIYSQIPDKAQAWQDLHRLAQDEDIYVRMYAYYSLGRISITKAIEADDGIILKRNLENAVNYFEKSSKEEPISGPARFCYSFYRTYFAIIFQETREDIVQQYITEAKDTIGISKSKDELIKAVENLARALQKSQNLKDKSIFEIESELKAYRWYCENAAEHMYAVEVKAPGAIKLMRRCNPLLEERIQAIIAKIQKSAKEIYQITRRSGTEYEIPGSEICKAAGALSSGNLASVEVSSSIIVMQLRKFCQHLPEDARGPVSRVVEEIERAPNFPEKLQNIAVALSNLSPVLQEHNHCLADIVILTVLPEEYGAIFNHLSDFVPLPDVGSRPNLYAWQFSNVYCSKYKGAYKVAIGMVGRAGNYQSSLAVKEAVELWRPRYIFFVGIAGGLPDLKRGDVVIADVVYGYEYGKINKKFKPRGNWTYRTDLALLNGAGAYALRDDWYKRIKVKPHENCKPCIMSGEIASGEQVVDDPSNEFFAEVLKRYSKVKAVEMEGAGVGSAIEQAQSLGFPTGFIVIRGISDLPRPKGKGKGTKERDDWKPYASDAVAAFTLGWIADGLPLKPSTE